MSCFFKWNQTVSEENALVLFNYDQQKCKSFLALL